MKFDGIKYTLGKNASRIWSVDQNMRKKVIFARANPARAAGQVAAAAADVAIVKPAKVVAVLGFEIGKAVVEPLIWAGRGAVSSTKYAIDARQNRRALADARSQQQWVIPGAEGSEAAPIVDGALVDNLRQGLIGAFAKADALDRVHKAVQVNWVAYGGHAGYALAVKAAKAVLVAAAVHTPGINHLALANVLSPASEERLLDAVGLNTVAAQLGVGTGILSAAHDGFARTLRNTNLWEKDLETRQYQKEQVSARRDIIVLENALKSIETLQHEGKDDTIDAKRVAQRHASAVRKIQQGVLAAERLQVNISGNKLAARFSGLQLSNESLSRRADNLLQRYGLRPSEAAADFNTLVSLPPAAAAVEAAPNIPRASLVQRFSAGPVGVLMQKRKLRAEVLRHKRVADTYRAEVTRLKAAASDLSADINPALRLAHVQNKRALAIGRSRLAKTRLRLLTGDKNIETQTLRASRLGERIDFLQSSIAAYRAYAVHPAVRASDIDWRMIMPRYAAEMNLLARDIKTIDRKIAGIDSALAIVKSISQRPVMEFRKKKLVAKREIALARQDKVALDLALADIESRHLPAENTPARAAMERFVGLSAIENRQAYAVRDMSITIATGLRALVADRQKRTSHYVRADAAPIGGAPAIVNTLLKGAWYSVAVVPLINLPYWGAVRAHAAWSNYRYLQTMQRAGQGA